MDLVVNKISKLTGISKELILSDNLRRDIVHARNICYYFMYGFQNIPVSQIKSLFNKNHVTIMYGIRDILQKQEKRFYYQPRNTKNDIKRIRQEMSIHQCVGEIVEFKTGNFMYGICIKQKGLLYLCRCFGKFEDVKIFREYFYTNKREIIKIDGKAIDEGYFKGSEFKVI